MNRKRHKERFKVAFAVRYDTGEVKRFVSYFATSDAADFAVGLFFDSTAHGSVKVFDLAEPCLVSDFEW